LQLQPLAVAGSAEAVDVDSAACRSFVLEREHVILCAELSELAHYALVLGVGALLAVEDRLGRVGAGLALRSAAAAATVPGPPKLLPRPVSRVRTRICGRASASAPR
jgi:hypothetical protein